MNYLFTKALALFRFYEIGHHEYLLEKKNKS